MTSRLRIPLLIAVLLALPLAVSDTYLLPLSQQTPRYVLFTASVDF